MKTTETRCKSILNPTRVGSFTHCINPYTGCEHACVYCYASFMCRYSGHENEEWGSFVDVKVNAPSVLKKALTKVKKAKKVKEGSVWFSSVTDPYQPMERKYQLTRALLEILSHTHFSVSILTKSDLVLRDLDVLGGFGERISAGFTLNFLNEEHRKVWEPHSSPIPNRLSAIKALNKAGIPTYVHVGPYLPGITSLPEILNAVGPYVFEIQVESLNFRGPKKDNVFRTICERYPHLKPIYLDYFQNPEVYRKKIAQEAQKSKKIKFLF